MRTAADAISYEDLYARWERGNWRATEIDFTQDARQWREDFTDFERAAALWNYALFFWGEDAVADGLSPYIDAAPRGGCRVKLCGRVEVAVGGALWALVALSSKGSVAARRVS
jgi:hypothetical protein